MAIHISTDDTQKLDVLFRRLIGYHDAQILDDIQTASLCSYIVGMAATDNEASLQEWLTEPAMLDKFVTGLTLPR
jgi:hypothetical protein